MIILSITAQITGAANPVCNCSTTLTAFVCRLHLPASNMENLNTAAYLDEVKVPGWVLPLEMVRLF